jgi:GAF domain
VSDSPNPGIKLNPRSRCGGDGGQLSTVGLPEFDDSFDRELAQWFALRKGVWSGTAAELLAAVQGKPDAGKPSRSQSAHTLYAHLESRRHILRSLGVEVRLHQGLPRMLSLRHCPVGISGKKPPATASAFHIASISAVNSIPLADHGQDAPAGPEEARPAASENSGQDISIGRTDSTARFVSGRHAEKESAGGRVFENTGMALSTVAEIRRLIRDQNLDLEAAIELMANRAQEITRCCGTAVGLLEENTVVYAVRTGIGATTAGLDLHANFFQSCVRTGGALQLRDAQRHPILGAMCQLEGVGSLVIVPIFHHRKVVGAMEFFYKESRSFSTGHVMDLEFIAGVVSERWSAAPEGDLKPEEPGDGFATAQANDNSKPQPFDNTDSAVLKSLSSRLAAAPSRMGRALKRVWTQGAQAEPLAQESGATVHTAPEIEVDGTAPIQTTPYERKLDVPSEPQKDGPDE